MPAQDLGGEGFEELAGEGDEGDVFYEEEEYEEEEEEFEARNPLVFILSVNSGLRDNLRWANRWSGCCDDRILTPGAASVNMCCNSSVSYQQSVSVCNLLSQRHTHASDGARHTTNGRLAGVHHCGSAPRRTRVQ